MFPLFLFTTFSLGLRFLNFQSLRSFLNRVIRVRTDPEIPIPIFHEQILWAVQVVSYFWPGSGGCLARAMTATFLLKKQGHPAHLRIGIAPTDGGEWEGHAWVECHGVTLHCGTDVSRYVPFTALEGSTL